MSNPELSLIKNLVSERLKLVDGLVRAQKIDEAIKEIGEIRRMDSQNPYALAYEERILALQTTLKAQPQRPQSIPTASTAEPKKDLPLSSKEADQTGVTKSVPPTIVSSGAPRYSVAPVLQKVQVQEFSDQYSQNSVKRSKGKASILLVDDDALLVQALAELLEDNRFSAVTYTKADDALEYLKANSPDLVICDVNLETSSFGGFTLHERMRKLDHLRDVPFVFLSGLNDSAIVLAGKEVGADDYLTKPIEPETLLAVVKGKLKRYRQIKKNP